MSKASRQMSINKHLGNAGEKQAANALARIGVLMVEEVGTPFMITKMGSHGWVQGHFKDKVSGDHRGHTVKGISVLAEVKTVWDRNLRWSDLKEHQPGRLSQHAECAISLLVWVHHSGIYIMPWLDVLVAGFRKGKSLTIEQAQILNIENILDIPK